MYTSVAIMYNIFNSINFVIIVYNVHNGYCTLYNPVTSMYSVCYS